jgi:3-hydroxybutyrate dehydrogenase
MLEGKFAIVTGSTSGIGLGIARALAAQGAGVMLNGFGDAAEIARLREEIAGRGAAVAYSAADLTKHGFREGAQAKGWRPEVQVGYSPADMSKPDEIVAMVEQATREFGRVDIVVNNAGIQFTAPIEEFPVERWDAILAINLSAVFHATRAVLPQMKQRNWGRIVNIASTHGLVASTQKAAYVAAKHGVLGLTKVVALETATTGVTCNAICPGWVLTPLVQKQIDDLAARERITSAQAIARLLGDKQPSLEFATAEQIGALAVYLCSDEAAQIRGAAIPVDGGWVAQ